MKINCRSVAGKSGNDSRNDTGMSFLHGLVAPALVVAAFAAGCGSTPSTNPGADAGTPDGALGVDGSADSGALPDSGGSADASSVSNDDSAVGPGSTESGSAEAGEGDSGSPGSEDAHADGPPLADDSGTDVPAGFFLRYEAEAPANTRTYPVEGVVTSEGAPCPGVPGTSSDGVKEGASCASGGHVVDQILGRSPCMPATSTTSYTDCENKGGGVTFNAVTAPADGTYDVTFWYHSGQDSPGHADTFGDVKCGGLNYDTGPGSGCRPHLVYVNGVQMASTVGGQNAVYYQFPAYPDSWTIVHGAVIALPLKAGANTIYIKAPGNTTSDAADIDALDVQPSGPGAPLYQPSGKGGQPALRIGLVTPVVNWN